MVVVVVVVVVVGGWGVVGGWLVQVCSPAIQRSVKFGVFEEVYLCQF